MTPSPFLKFYLDNGEQVLVDVEGKDHKEISQHVKKILGKSEEVLQAEAQAKMQASNPANFGPIKYCLRECMCEVEGQVPCPGSTPLPKEMTGKYRAQMAASQEWDARGGQPSAVDSRDNAEPRFDFVRLHKKKKKDYPVADLAVNE